MSRKKNPIKKSQGGKRIPLPPGQIGLMIVSFFASWCEVNWYDIFVIHTTIYQSFMNSHGSYTMESNSF